MRDRCRAGVDAAYAAFAGTNSIVLPAKPTGGMYVMFSVAGEADSGEACRRILEEAHVGLAPGWLFGPSSKSFIRMCICRDSGDVEEACRRIATALRSEQRPGGVRLVAAGA